LESFGAMEKDEIAKFWVETMFLELYNSFVARYETAEDGN